MEAGDRGVDLDPVAGGEDHRLADVRLADQAVEDAGQVGRRPPRAAPAWPPGGAVGRADNEQFHEPTASDCRRPRLPGDGRLPVDPP